MASEITSGVGIAPATPRGDGLRLPARFVKHSRTLLSCPCRAGMFGPLMQQAREERRLRDVPVSTVHAGLDPSFGRARLIELADDYVTSREAS